MFGDCVGGYLLEAVRVAVSGVWFLRSVDLAGFGEESVFPGYCGSLGLLWIWVSF